MGEEDDDDHTHAPARGPGLAHLVIDVVVAAEGGREEALGEGGVDLLVGLEGAEVVMEEAGPVRDQGLQLFAEEEDWDQEDVHQAIPEEADGVGPGPGPGAILSVPAVLAPDLLLARGLVPCPIRCTRSTAGADPGLLVDADAAQVGMTSGTVDPDPRLPHERQPSRLIVWNLVSAVKPNIGILKLLLLFVVVFNISTVHIITEKSLSNFPCD